MNTEDEEFTRIEQEIKRKTGRPPIDPAHKKQMVAVCLTPLQRYKLRKLGGSKWLQDVIDIDGSSVDFESTTKGDKHGA
jgi:hypothetical protein